MKRSTNYETFTCPCPLQPCELNRSSILVALWRALEAIHILLALQCNSLETSIDFLELCEFFQNLSSVLCNVLEIPQPCSSCPSQSSRESTGYMALFKVFQTPQKTCAVLQKPPQVPWSSTLISP